MLNIAILNGGRGAATLIPSLLGRQGLHVTSIINAYDDGKSTGEIRRFFQMLGPSDIRKVQALMLPGDDPDAAANARLFYHRYPIDADRGVILSALADFATGRTDVLAETPLTNPAVIAGLRRYAGAFIDALQLIERVKGEAFDFADCSIMNCLYAGAFLDSRRNIETATLAIDRLFRLRGTVLPTSIENKVLAALRENGEMLYTEAEIVELRSNVRIERVYLLDAPPEPRLFDSLTTADKRAWLDRHHCYVGTSPAVQHALRQADIIIYAPGTQHSSLYPTYLATGLSRAIADNARAFKAYVTNIGADYETPEYRASDYLRGAWHYLNLSEARRYTAEELFDVVLINRSHAKADETYVVYDADNFADLPVRRIVENFESAAAPGQHDGAYVVDTILRLHDAHAGSRG